MKARQRFALEQLWSALADTAAFVLTVGYVDHLRPDSHCPHCARKGRMYK